VYATPFSSTSQPGGYHVVFNLRQNLLYAFHLFGRDGCAGITLDAALAETCVKVAAKELFGKVERDQYILYL
jgi:hypothetical protein